MVKDSPKTVEYTDVTRKNPVGAHLYHEGKKGKYTGHHSPKHPRGGTSPRPKKGHPDKIHKVMHEFKHHELHSGSKKGPKVKGRSQAIAIALSEQRKANKGGYK